MSTRPRATLATAIAALLAPALLVTPAADAQPLRNKAGHHWTYAGHRTHAYAYQRPAYGHARGRYAYTGHAYGGRPYADPYGPTSANPYPPTAADDPYSPYAVPGAAIRAMARRNQYAPGLTNELAPDNIATATGGPSGGVPGMSGR